MEVISTRKFDLIFWINTNKVTQELKLKFNDDIYLVKEEKTETDRMVSSEIKKFKHLLIAVQFNYLIWSP